jgi:hypothetical protein
VLTIYYLLSGLLMLVLPWTVWWPKAIALPGFLAVVFANPWFKGFISGFGLVLFLAGLLEIRSRMED